MFLKILFFIYILHSDYVYLLKKNRIKSSVFTFQNMNSVMNIKSLHDVKKKLQYEKEAYCLIINKYKVNDILKNKYIRFWLLNIYKFPSVLLYKDYKNSIIKQNDKSINLFDRINKYFENADTNNKNKEHLSLQTNTNLNQSSNKNITTVNYNILDKNEENIEDYRLVPLNDYFDKVIKEVFDDNEKIYVKENQFMTDTYDMDNLTSKDNTNATSLVTHYNHQTNNNEHPIDENVKDVNNGYTNEIDTSCDDNKWDVDSESDKEQSNMNIFYNKNKLIYLEELYKIIKKEKINIKKVILKLGYDNMNTSEILKKIFPHTKEIIHKYEIVGHIAHLNFCEKLVDHKKIISEIILDKNKSIKTVINKKNMLNNIHRTFDIELLAGEHNYITELKENNLKIKLNYELIYWSSKLKKERDRIYDIVENNSIIIDLFAGVGIFSLLLSKKSCICFSNDINEHAYNYMNINIKANKKKNIFTYNLDARKFVEKLIELNIFSKNENILTIYIDEQNKKNISEQVLNSIDHNIYQKNNKIYNEKKKKESLKKRINNNTEINDHLQNDLTKIDDNQMLINNINKNDGILTNITNGDNEEKYDINKSNLHMETHNNIITNDNIKLKEQKIGNKHISVVNYNLCNNVSHQNNTYLNGTSNDSNSITGDIPKIDKNKELFKININPNIYNDIHVLMNLPQNSLHFLDAFKKLKYENKQLRNIFIHCYYFSKPEFFYEHAEKNILLHFQMLPKQMKITEIRKVSPNKLMYVVEFNLKELLQS
ncbi:met-10+ like protein, putative [Hepatocystis sp. ex Piliocolobus tephrosceles]|uniref:tRNA (guanine(37)-N1)-methyltransferase n=1 Tax=Piliocolobus tephrosceles TaxID=591936 RepID=A0A8C9LLB4_9PRIM|nr:met-10+ like protein, putative [Hepatocystis sp. ex Piliocolobus tephrosceles]